jgi:hypothetical protein
MRPILVSLGLCALLTALPVQAAAPASEDLLALSSDDHLAQILGWSDDGKRFVMRLYLSMPFAPRDANHGPTYCEGYVNHEGHYFNGALVWLAYERGHLLKSFAILDPNTCTPVPVAEQRVTEAKKQLSTLGIRLDTPGKELTTPINGSVITVEEGPQAPYALEYEEKITPKTAKPKSGVQKGTLEQTVYLHKGSTRQKVLSRRSSYEYSTAMAGYMQTGMDRVWLSPSGNTLVVLGYERVGNLSGGRKSLRMLGMLGWSGNTLKPL